MLDKLKLFTILVAIPLTGYLVFGWVNSKQETEWHQALQQTIKGAPADRLNIYSLQVACGDTELAPKISEICSPYLNVRTVQVLALWSGVGSVIFPVLVLLAGAISKVNRNLLLRIFAPGLYISNIVVSLLVVVQGAVLMGTIYYGEPALIGRVHYGYSPRQE